MNVTLFSGGEYHTLDRNVFKPFPFTAAGALPDAVSQDSEVISMENTLSLNRLRPGEAGVVSELLTTGSMRRRLLDIGLVENTKVRCLGRSPAGDPSAYLIRGAVIAIRSEDCAGVLLARG